MYRRSGRPLSPSLNGDSRNGSVNSKQHHMNGHSHDRDDEDTDSPSHKAAKSRRRFLLSMGSLVGFAFLFLHLFGPNADNPSFGFGGASTKLLPGFGYRSKQSRRTDFYLRDDRRRRSAASIQGSAYPPANFSQSPPFTFCPTFGSGDELANLYGPEAILKSRTHLGSVDRVRRVIKRAMAGLPITIGVLGGSVSSCHGLDATSAHPFGNPIGPNCYPHRIFSWLNDVFPHPANELTNGALRRTGTSYFGFCSEMHLPDRVDLVIVEFDTEDANEASTLASTDLLIRSLLLRPDQPAVIMLGHFSPQIQGEHGFAGPEIWHSAVSQFYDIPHLSVKGLIYEDYLINPQNVRSAYFLDPVLANSKGHQVLADTVITYLESEICAVWELESQRYFAGYDRSDSAKAQGKKNKLDLTKENVFGPAGGIAVPGQREAPPSLLGGKGLRKDSGGLNAGNEGRDTAQQQQNFMNRKAVDSGPSAKSARIPPFRITDRPHTMPHFREIKPHCASANDLVNPLPKSIFAGSGWDPVAPKPEDEDERHYWFSDTPGSSLKVPIKVGSGDIAVYYLKGPASENWGDVLCWVDDNTAGAVELKGSWDRDYSQPVVTQIDRGVTKGAHFVVCELQRKDYGSSQFKIYAAFAS